MNDTDIRRDVEAGLRSEPSVGDARAISVAVRGGVTTLSGQVGTAGERSAAEDAARRVSGVTAVVNKLDVRWTALGL
jgi:osmotically-inducible protein OsmY